MIGGEALRWRSSSAFYELNDACFSAVLNLNDADPLAWLLYVCDCMLSDEFGIFLTSKSSCFRGGTFALGDSIYRVSCVPSGGRLFISGV